MSTNNQNPEGGLYLKIIEKKRSLWKRQGNSTGEGGRRQTRWKIGRSCAQFIYLTSLIVRGKKLVRNQGDREGTRELIFLGKGDLFKCKAEVRRVAWRRINKNAGGQEKRS